MRVLVVACVQDHERRARRPEIAVVPAPGKITTQITDITTHLNEITTQITTNYCNYLKLLHDTIAPHITTNYYTRQYLAVRVLVVARVHDHEGRARRSKIAVAPAPVKIATQMTEITTPLTEITIQITTND